MTAHCGLGSLVHISYLQMVATIFCHTFVICLCWRSMYSGPLASFELGYLSH